MSLLLIMSSSLIPLHTPTYPFPHTMLHLKLMRMPIQKKRKEKEKVLASHKWDSTYWL